MSFERNCGYLPETFRSSANIRSIQERGPRAHLVTSDGSIDCSTEPNEQEAVVAHLHFCETVAALQLLDRGGHFVLKMFTLFEGVSSRQPIVAI